mmetsp:Transcript_842/g.5250  ORF Transcript_842/g.5250 Transcript_842/m.5250 type:complete len:96 (-) Transcript_842:1554-1841(-)
MPRSAQIERLCRDRNEGQGVHKHVSECAMAGTAHHWGRKDRKKNVRKAKVDVAPLIAMNDFELTVPVLHDVRTRPDVTAVRWWSHPSSWPTGQCL